SPLAALCLLAPTFAGAQATSAPAQDEEEIVRISSELVQTDVMVFDKSGKFVDGLKQDEFELKVDGKPQSIGFFDRIESGTVNEDAQLAAARGTKSGTDRGASLPLDRGRTVVFFVDDLHLSPSSYSRIHKTLLRFIDDEIGQNDEAAVISASGQIGFLQQFTENKAVLRAAASRLGVRPYSTRDTQNPPMTEAHAFAIQNGDTGVLDYFIDALLRETPNLSRQMAASMVESRANSIAEQSRSIARNTLASLHSMVRNSSQIPGRKVFFFISDGFLVEDRDGDLRDWMRRIADAAARAGVVIYTLDAQGLRAGNADASSSVAFDPGGRLSSVNNSEISGMQSPLYTLAGETGGRALVNTNALNRAVVSALKETSLYYLLAWRPESAAGRGSPKYQRIEVSIRNRPELRVIVRRGFYSSQPPPESSRGGEKKKKKNAEAETDIKVGTLAAQSKSERELLEVVRAPMPRAGLPTSLALNYVNTADGGAVLTTSVELDRAALTFERGEKEQASFDLFGVILNDRGKVAYGFKQQMTVIANPSIPAEQQRVMYSYPAPLAPGLYQVRVGTRDSRSGRLGSAMQWIEIPEFKRGRLSMSSIFLGERTSDARAGEVKIDATPGSVLLSVDRRFSRTSWIRLLTFIYNATSAGAAQPDVALQIQIFRDDQPVFTAPLSKLTTEGFADPTRIPYAAELALASFPAGRYVLQVTAIDRAAKTSASQRASFVIH
ncbi:MAG TPA: VWA domain-containing protein, partial [Pyrinomonadaceae bacterium]|nr:VWA domain-containing protein [Pyrinomonadaceae bacterium]